MRKSTRIAATVASAGLIAAAMAAPATAARPDWSKKSNETIVATAITLSTQESAAGVFDENRGDFDILIRALLVTGVVDIFGSTNFTVFAPTDQAFFDTLKDLGVIVATEEEAFNAAAAALGGVEGVAKVLGYHVTEGVRNSKSVTRAKQITMLDAGTISARGGAIRAGSNAAGFVATDVRVSDGMIHVIDRVLLP